MAYKRILGLDNIILNVASKSNDTSQVLPTTPPRTSVRVSPRSAPTGTSPPTTRRRPGGLETRSSSAGTRPTRSSHPVPDETLSPTGRDPRDLSVPKRRKLDDEVILNLNGDKDDEPNHEIRRSNRQRKLSYACFDTEYMTTDAVIRYRGQQNDYRVPKQVLALC